MLNSFQHLNEVVFRAFALDPEINSGSHFIHKAQKIVLDRIISGRQSAGDDSSDEQTGIPYAGIIQIRLKGVISAWHIIMICEAPLSIIKVMIFRILVKLPQPGKAKIWLNPDGTGHCD